MKNGLPQCKDVPNRPILEFLALIHDGKIVHCYVSQRALVSNVSRAACAFEGFANSIGQAFQHGAPESGGHRHPHLILAKMKSMIRKGWVKGCACGCRGDFVITEAGLQHLETIKEVAAYTPYNG